MPAKNEEVIPPISGSPPNPAPDPAPDPTFAQTFDDLLETPFSLGFVPRPLLRIGFVEQIIKRDRIIIPCFTRPTMIEMIEKGILEGTKSNFGWLIYEDSFIKWIKDLQTPAYVAAKANA